MTKLRTGTFERITPALIRQNPERVAGLVDLVWAAAEEFYAPLPLSNSDIRCMIAGEIGAPASHLAETLVFHEEEDAALVGGTPMRSLASAQMAAAAESLRKASPHAKAQLLALMRAFSESTQPIDAEGFYISRVAVAAAKRGRGLGRKIVVEFLSRLAPVPVHLHVHKDNLPAIALYRSLGFRPRPAGDPFQYTAFTRPPGGVQEAKVPA